MQYHTDHLKICIKKTFFAAGFELVEKTSPLPNFIWKGPIKAKELINLNHNQKINHFVGIASIGDKASLWRNVSKMSRKHAEFNICPCTYILPQAFQRWEQERKLNGYRDVFIMKPNHLSCAKGIKIVGKRDEIKNKHNFIL